MVTSLPILNLADARFECTFGRGCEGICCRRGRPPVYPEEVGRIDSKLDLILPALRPCARTLITKTGYLTRRRRGGNPKLRVAEGWCVFFNQGCVLQKLGHPEGNTVGYKPYACALFPLERDFHDRWYVRQWGFQGEIWDLFCLNPQASRTPAAESLSHEIALAERITAMESQPGES